MKTPDSTRHDVRAQATRRQHPRFVWAAGCLALLVAGCGGGGGGGNNSQPTASISLSTTTLDVTATTSDASPSATFDVTATTAAPGTIVYFGGGTTNAGVYAVSSTQRGNTLTVRVDFQSPLALGPGIYHDTITVKGCFDTACTQQVANSPQTVAVTYTVTGPAVPIRTLASLSPASLPAASPAFTLTANGTNFFPGDIVVWNGLGRPTTFLSSTQLTARISAADIATPGPIAVYVAASAGAPTSNSNPLNFTVLPPAPISLTAVSPATVTAGDLGFTLTLQGTSFTANSVVEWNGTALPTTFVSGVELLAQVPPSDIATVGSAQVTAQDPGPPAGSTGAKTITIAAPSIDAVSFLMTPAHTNAINFRSVSFPATSAWSVDVGGAPSYALIVDGLVIVTVQAGGGSQLLALDQATGKTVWGPIVLNGPSNAAYDAGRVFTLSFVLLSASLMEAFDVATGTQQWGTPLTPQWSFTSGPTARNGLVYTGGAGDAGTLYALDEATGAISWTLQVMNGEDSTPAVSADGVYVTYPCQTYALRPLTGESIWQDSTGCEGGGGGTSAVANGVLYAPNGAGTIGGTAFDARSGTVLGTYATDVPGAYTAATAFFLQGGTLRGVALSNNAEIWSFTGDGQLVTSPIVVNQYVIIGSASGNVYAVDAATGTQVWSTNVGGTIPAGVHWGAGLPLSGIAAGDGLLVVPSGTNVTAYTLSTNP